MKPYLAAIRSVDQIDLILVSGRAVTGLRIEFPEEIICGSLVTGVFGRENETRRIAAHVCGGTKSPRALTKN